MVGWQSPRLPSGPRVAPFRSWLHFAKRCVPWSLPFRLADPRPKLFPPYTTIRHKSASHPFTYLGLNIEILPSLVSAPQLRVAVTNALRVPLPGLLVVSLSPSDHARSATLRTRSSRARLVFIYRNSGGFRLRFGSGVPLRLRSARRSSPSTLHFLRSPTRRPKPSRSQTRTRP